MHSGSRHIGKHDQAEPRGLQYIELPALQVDRGEILIPNGTLKLFPIVVNSTVVTFLSWFFL